MRKLMSIKGNVMLGDYIWKGYYPVATDKYPDKKTNSVELMVYDSKPLPISDLLELMWTATDLTLTFDDEFYCFHGIRCAATGRYSIESNIYIFDETRLNVLYRFASYTCGEIN